MSSQISGADKCYSHILIIMYVCILKRIASIIQPEQLAYLPAGSPPPLRSVAVIPPHDFAGEAVRVFYKSRDSSRQHQSGRWMKDDADSHLSGKFNHSCPIIDSEIMLFRKDLLFCHMNGISIRLIQKSEELPEMVCDNFFHSTDFSL